MGSPELALLLRCWPVRIECVTVGDVLGFESSHLSEHILLSTINIIPCSDLLMYENIHEKDAVYHRMNPLNTTQA